MDKLRKVAAPLLAAVALAVFFLPALTSARQFLWRDAGRLHAPTKLHLGHEFARGVWPQWNPYEGLGQPRIAGSVDALLHPFNLLLLLPSAAANKLWIVASFWFAWMGAYLWARGLGRSRAASTVAGLAFALSGHLVSSSDNETYLTTYAALPWIFAAVHAWSCRGGPLRLAAVGVASFLCIAAGDPQAWGLAAAAVPVYAALACEGTARARALKGVAAAGLALAAAAPVLLPVLLWLPETVRAQAQGAGGADLWNLAPVRLLELVLPGVFAHDPGALEAEVFRAYGGGQGRHVMPWVRSVYLGGPVIALALLGAVRAKPARVLGGLSLLALWMALGPAAGFLAVARHVPVLQALRYWEKVVIWPSLLLAIGAAFGVDALLASPPGRRALAVLGTLLALGGGVLAAATVGGPALASALQRGPGQEQVARMLVDNLAAGALHLTAISAVLLLGWILLRSGRIARAAPALIVGIVGVDLGAANAGAYVLLDPEVAWPASKVASDLEAQPGERRLVTFSAQWAARPGLSPREAWQRSSAAMLEPCWNVPYRIDALYYYGALHSRLGARLIGAHLVEGNRRRVLGLGAWSLGFLVVPPTVALVADLGLGPESVAAWGTDPPWRLVSIPHRPRAYLAGPLRSVDAEGAHAFALGEPMRTGESVVEAPIPDGYRPSAGTAKVEHAEADRVEVQVRAEAPSLLVLNDLFAPGWTATVDGREAPILRANFAVRGVWVEPGDHRVAFAYSTPGLLAGLLAALAGLAGCGAWALWRRRQVAPAAAPTP